MGELYSTFVGSSPMLYGAVLALDNTVTSVLAYGVILVSDVEMIVEFLFLSV